MRLTCSSLRPCEWSFEVTTPTGARATAERSLRVALDPRVVGFVDGSAPIRDFFTRSSTGLVVATETGLEILDANDPLQPLPVSQLPLDPPPRFLGGENGATRLYLGRAEAGFVVVDIEDPANPRLAATVEK